MQNLSSLQYISSKNGFSGALRAASKSYIAGGSDQASFTSMHELIALNLRQRMVQSDLAGNIVRSLLFIVFIKQFEYILSKLLSLGKCDRATSGQWAREIMIAKAFSPFAWVSWLWRTPAHPSNAGNSSERHRNVPGSRILIALLFVVIVIGIEFGYIMVSQKRTVQVTTDDIRLSHKITPDLRNMSSSISRGGCIWEDVSGKNFEPQLALGVCNSGGTGEGKYLSFTRNTSDMQRNISIFRNELHVSVRSIMRPGIAPTPEHTDAIVSAGIVTPHNGVYRIHMDYDVQEIVDMVKKYYLRLTGRLFKEIKREGVMNETTRLGWVKVNEDDKEAGKAFISFGSYGNSAKDSQEDIYRFRAETLAAALVGGGRNWRGTGKKPQQWIGENKDLKGNTQIGLATYPYFPYTAIFIIFGLNFVCALVIHAVVKTISVEFVDKEIAYKLGECRTTLPEASVWTLGTDDIITRLGSMTNDADDEDKSGGSKTNHADGEDKSGGSKTNHADGEHKSGDMEQGDDAGDIEPRTVMQDQNI